MESLAWMGELFRLHSWKTVPSPEAKREKGQVRERERERVNTRQLPEGERENKQEKERVSTN